LEIEDYSYLPDADMLEEEKHLLIQKAIDELPDKYKKIIQMKYEQDMHYEEIAKELNLPEGTVKTNLFRAKKIMELLLRKNSDVFNV
jgi:RNA polymerase sigma-70 factor (ECF subfamily)